MDPAGRRGVSLSPARRNPSYRRNRAIKPLTRLLIVGILILLVELVKPLTAAGAAPAAGETTLMLGFLLLAAYVAGKVAGDFRLPKVTGYILLGVVVGPGVLEVLSEEQVQRLDPVNDIAISLIALSAGGELRLRQLRERGRQIAGILGAEMVVVFVLVSLTVLLASDHLSFTQGSDLTTVLTVAFVFGSIAIANSPSVTIAVINDSRARGPVSTTVLSVTVVKDVVVVIAFAIAVSTARSILGGGSGGGNLAATLSWEVGGSLVAGAVSGWVTSLYLSRISAQPVLFVLAVAFVNAQIAAALHMEVLLFSLVAGLVVENLDPQRGDEFVEAVEKNSLVFYALFFSLAGAHIMPAQLGPVLPVVAGFVAVRTTAVWLGTHLGARWTGAPETVRRYAWVGFISQAGVTLGMVSIVAREFPEWGSELYVLFLAMVAVHELLGPVLLQWGLSRSGETGMRDQPEGHPATAVRSGHPNALEGGQP